MRRFSTCSSSRLSSPRGTLSRRFWGLQPWSWVQLYAASDGFQIRAHFCSSHPVTPRQKRWQQGEPGQMGWERRKKQGKEDAVHLLSYRSLSKRHEQHNFLHRIAHIFSKTSNFYQCKSSFGLFSFPLFFIFFPGAGKEGNFCHSYLVPYMKVSPSLYLHSLYEHVMQ